MYAQVERHFTEGLDIWPVVVARLSNFTAFCMICNKTLEVSSTRYPLSGVYVTFADLQLHRSSQRCTNTHTKKTSLNIISIISLPIARRLEIDDL